MLQITKDKKRGKIAHLLYKERENVKVKDPISIQIRVIKLPPPKIFCLECILTRKKLFKE